MPYFDNLEFVSPVDRVELVFFAGKNTMEIPVAKVALIQFAFYGGYAVIAITAAM
jgi:hypothetical protein